MLNAMEAATEERLSSSDLTEAVQATSYMNEVTANDGINRDDISVMTDGQLDLKDQGYKETQSCLQRGKFQCANAGDKTTISQCYGFKEVCDKFCDCEDCSDELNCGGGERSLKSRSSPVLSQNDETGFWKVVRLPSNGSLSLRIPFVTHGKLSLEAISIGSRGTCRVMSTSCSVEFNFDFCSRSHKTSKANCESWHRFQILHGASTERVFRGTTFATLDGHQLRELTTQEDFQPVLAQSRSV